MPKTNKFVGQVKATQLPQIYVCMYVYCTQAHLSFKRNLEIHTTLKNKTSQEISTNKSSIILSKQKHTDNITYRTFPSSGPKVFQNIRLRAWEPYLKHTS